MGILLLQQDNPLAFLLSRQIRDFCWLVKVSISYYDFFCDIQPLFSTATQSVLPLHVSILFMKFFNECITEYDETRLKRT